MTRLKGLRLPGMTTVLDAKDAKFAELFEPDNRRHWVPLSDIPEYVQKAFVAAEDKRFYEHHGIDERSVIRAFMNMVAEPNRRQGGSTITQQVAKNLLVGDGISYERKIREVIVAGRIEQAICQAGNPRDLSQFDLPRPLVLGRRAGGARLFRQAGQGPDARRRRLPGRPDQGPGLFQSGPASGARAGAPRIRARPHEGRRRDHRGANGDGAEAERLKFAALSRPRRDHRIPSRRRDRARGPRGRRHQQPDRAVLRGALHHPAGSAARRRSRLAGGPRAIRAAGRTGRIPGAEANLTDRDRQGRGGSQGRSQQTGLADRARAAAAAALRRALDAGGGGREGAASQRRRVRSASGSRDGRIVPLSTFGSRTRGRIGVNDVVYVKVIEGKGKQGARAELRMRPTVQGAAVVLENKTGRVLAMVGGFSYPLSQLNRVTQARRQPGSVAQADDLSRRAARRPAAQHAGGRRADHLSADQRRQPLHARHGLLDAAQLRRSASTGR